MRFPCFLWTVGGMLDNRKVSGHERQRFVLAVGGDNASPQLNLMVVLHRAGNPSPARKIKFLIDVFQRARREQVRCACGGEQGNDGDRKEAPHWNLQGYAMVSYRSSGDLAIVLRDHL